MVRPKYSISKRIMKFAFAAREWAEYEAELRARGRIKPAGSHDSFDDIPAADYDGAKVSRRESERSRR